MAADCEVDGCGVIAVGRCLLGCRRAICSSHQAQAVIWAPLASRSEPLNLCLPCQAQANRGDPELAARHASEAYEQPLERLRAIADPTERLVTAIAIHGRVETWGVEKGKVELSGLVPIQIMREMFPDWDQLLLSGNPWDGDEVARWLATRAIAAGIPTDGEYEWNYYTTGLFGRRKNCSEQIPGWQFPQPNTRDRLGGTHYIFVDGRFSPCDDNFPAAVLRSTHYTVSSATIYGMAKRLGLTRGS